MRSRNDSQATAKVLYELYVAMRRMTALPLGEYNELLVLNRLRQLGAMRVTQIAELEGITQPGVTSILRRLTAKQLVDQQVDPEDARAVLTSVTKLGVGFLESTEKSRVLQLAKCIEELSGSDRSVLSSSGFSLSELSKIIETQTK